MASGTGMAPRQTIRHYVKAGLLTGVAVGLVLAVLHAGYNQLSSLREVGLLHFWFVAIYTILFTGYFFAAGVVVWLARWSLARRGDSSKEAGQPGWLAAAVFPLLFAPMVVGALYQFPSHKTPFQQDRVGVLIFAGLLTVLLFVLALAGSWIGGRALAAVGAWRWSRIAGGTVLAGGLTVSTAMVAPLIQGQGEVFPEAEGAVNTQAAATGVKVLELGFDGAAWEVLGPLMAAGGLPHFARLVETGASGPLHTIDDANSAVIWNTIHTGKHPRQHGILDFYNIRLPGIESSLYPIHRSSFRELTIAMNRLNLVEMVFINATMARTRPVWDLLSGGGWRVGVVDGYMTWPANQGVRGFIIAQHADRNIHRPSVLSRMVYPETMIAAFQEVFPEGPSKRSEFEWKGDWLESVLDDGQPDYLKVFVHEPDPIQHRQWSWIEPHYYASSLTADRDPADNPIYEVYRRMDAFLGRLLAGLAPETHIIILSDHGFGALFWGGEEVYGRIEGGHRWGPPGILIMNGPHITPGTALEDASVYDIVPTTLALMGMPVGADMPGRVLDDALDPAFLRRYPLRTISTYETGAGTSSMTREKTPDNEATLEELEALGYF